jgi:type IV secretion system protein VirD4
MIFKPAEVGWRLGRAYEPRGGELWVPWDRTTGVIGPQGSGKTLDLLAPALLQAPGAALVTLTKADDLLLSFAARSGDDRPCVVLDPFGLAAGLPELVWDPVAGCGLDDGGAAGQGVHRRYREGCGRRSTGGQE